DFSKEGTVIIPQLSPSIQAIFFVSMLICDALIIRKIYILGKSRMHLTPSTVHSSEISEIANGTINIAAINMPYNIPAMNTSKPNKFERRIAFAFLWLSLSFLIPTIIFNSRFVITRLLSDGIISKISNLVNYSKFMVYIFSLPSIRRQFLQMLFR
ncbi:hypothetical protein PMAYCL1PPCAC_09120, partial [Pristionchus mayeri]